MKRIKNYRNFNQIPTSKLPLECSKNLIDNSFVVTSITINNHWLSHSLLIYHSIQFHQISIVHSTRTSFTRLLSELIVTVDIHQLFTSPTNLNPSISSFSHSHLIWQSSSFIACTYFICFAMLCL